jgi:hypothetical protein
LSWFLVWVLGGKARGGLLVVVLFGKVVQEYFIISVSRLCTYTSPQRGLQCACFPKGSFCQFVF